MSDTSPATELANINALLANASVEMTCKDVSDLAEAATLLPAGTDIFIALFPNQTFEELTAASRTMWLKKGFRVPRRSLLQRLRELGGF